MSEPPGKRIKVELPHRCHEESKGSEGSKGSEASKAYVLPPKRVLPEDHEPRLIPPPKPVVPKSMPGPVIIDDASANDADADADPTGSLAKLVIPNTLRCPRFLIVHRDKNAPGYHGQAWVPHPDWVHHEEGNPLRGDLKHEAQLSCSRCLTTKFEVVYFAGETHPRFVCGCGLIL
jgi:hypothetical protein